MDLEKFKNERREERAGCSFRSRMRECVWLDTGAVQRHIVARLGAEHANHGREGHGRCVGQRRGSSQGESVREGERVGRVEREAALALGAGAALQVPVRAQPQLHAHTTAAQTHTRTKTKQAQ